MRTNTGSIWRVYKKHVPLSTDPKLISVIMEIFQSRSAPVKLFDLEVITIALFILVRSVSDFFTLENYWLQPAFCKAGNDTYKFKNIAPTCLNLVEVFIYIPCPRDEALK